MIAAVLCVTSALVPTTDRIHVSHPQSRIAAFIYLASFVMHLGAQIWMTFVSGNHHTWDRTGRNNHKDEGILRNSCLDSQVSPCTSHYQDTRLGRCSVSCFQDTSPLMHALVSLHFLFSSNIILYTHGTLKLPFRFVKQLTESSEQLLRHIKQIKNCVSGELKNVSYM